MTKGKRIQDEERRKAAKELPKGWRILYKHELVKQYDKVWMMKGQESDPNGFQPCTIQIGTPAKLWHCVIRKEIFETTMDLIGSF